MKKILALMLTLCVLLGLSAFACAEETKAEGVMTYAEYAAADLDTAVVVESYIQAKQAIKDGKVSLYLQDQDGAYFVYGVPCTEEDYAKLVPGSKIKVTGYKAAWAGEVEITDATVEVEEGTFTAEPVDVTDKLASEELINYQNQLVSFKGMTVEASTDDGAAFLYNWDGSGAHDSNSDLYFKVSKDGQTYSFTVESYLCDNTTDVYAAVENLKVGDVIDLTGFLYWYEGANPHIISVAAAQ